MWKRLWSIVVEANNFLKLYYYYDFLEMLVSVYLV